MGEQMKQSHVTYSCDKCHAKLKTDENTLDIVTSLTEGGGYWSRLHIRVTHIHGIHNDATTEKAELCKQCTVELLLDAVKRIRAGERATAGTEGIEAGGWR